MTNGWRFNPWFKRDSVRLLTSAQKPPADIARELGVPRNSLY
jgi:transposase-like protein